METPIFQNTQSILIRTGIILLMRICWLWSLVIRMRSLQRMQTWPHSPFTDIKCSELRKGGWIKTYEIPYLEGMNIIKHP